MQSSRRSSKSISSPDLYYDLLLAALSQYNIGLLTNIWFESHNLGKPGLILRAIILENFPELATRYQLPITENMNFADLLAAYNRKLFEEECTDPEACLYKYAKEGNWQYVKFSVEKGAKDFDWALRAAAQGVPLVG